MKLTINILIVFFTILFTGKVQSQTQPEYQNPGDVLSAFFSAISSQDAQVRTNILSELFIEKGTIHTVIQKTMYIGNVKGGGYDSFLAASAPFYEKHTMTYDEVERSIDYYVDMAAVHSLVYQSIREKAAPSMLYEQMMWFNFSLVYEKNRWFLTDVSWVNAYDEEPIDDAMQQDTLWHSGR